ncbi:hypothetical protein CF326_g9009 [Tilletia indica]|nr:hypothetical protein CF326_g9009 [Tilletia indica]
MRTPYRHRFLQRRVVKPLSAALRKPVRFFHPFARYATSLATTPSTSARPPVPAVLQMPASSTFAFQTRMPSFGFRWPPYGFQHSPPASISPPTAFGFKQHRCRLLFAPETHIFTLRSGLQRPQQSALGVEVDHSLRFVPSSPSSLKMASSGLQSVFGSTNMRQYLWLSSRRSDINNSVVEIGSLLIFNIQFHAPRMPASPDFVSLSPVLCYAARASASSRLSHGTL